MYFFMPFFLRSRCKFVFLPLGYTFSFIYSTHIHTYTYVYVMSYICIFLRTEMCNGSYKACVCVGIKNPLQNAFFLWVEALSTGHCFFGSIKNCSICIFHMCIRCIYTHIHARIVVTYILDKIPSFGHFIWPHSLIILISLPSFLFWCVSSFF